MTARWPVEAVEGEGGVEEAKDILTEVEEVNTVDMRHMETVEIMARAVTAIGKDHIMARITAAHTKEIVIPRTSSPHTIHISNLRTHTPHNNLGRHPRTNKPAMAEGEGLLKIQDTTRTIAVVGAEVPREDSRTMADMGTRKVVHMAAMGAANHIIKGMAVEEADTGAVETEAVEEDMVTQEEGTTTAMVAAALALAHTVGMEGLPSMMAVMAQVRTAILEAVITARIEVEDEAVDTDVIGILIASLDMCRRLCCNIGSVII